MRLLTVLAAVLFSASAVANEHKDNGPYYAFYHLQVANPAALVESMDRFWASDWGSNILDVALSQEVFNGGTALHTLLSTRSKIYGSSESSGNNAIVF